MIDRRYAALMCPACGTAPQTGRDACAQCGRRYRTAGGGLDLLTDDERAEADSFAAEYTALRAREGWTEGPRRAREKAIAGAAALLRSRVGANPLLVDVGSGGGWPAGTLVDAEVIAIDLIEAHPAHGLEVRGDMRRLPIRSASADAALYAASLHYAPLDVALAEAARILKPGGALVALDSPVYDGAAAARAAQARSSAYYARAGHEALAAHYHPVELGALRDALGRSGFEAVRVSPGSRWRRVLGRGPDSFIVATRLR